MRRTITTQLTIFAMLILTSFNAYSKCQIISNIKGYTPVIGSEKLTVFDWLAFDKGKVVAVSKKESIKDFSHCQQINGHGKFLLPGLIDAHIHVSGLGNQMLRVKLRGVTSEINAVQKVNQFAQQNLKSPWILGRGWNQVLWLNKPFPSKATLDQTGIKRPILLRRIDGHAAWVNSKALALAGIDQSTPDPQGGKIERDNEGDATGLLIDNEY